MEQLRVRSWLRWRRLGWFQSRCIMLCMCQVGLFILRYKLQILIFQDFEDWSYEFQNIIEGEIVCFIN